MNIEQAKTIFERAKHFDKLAYDENVHSMEDWVLLNYREAKGYIEAWDAAVKACADQINMCKTGRCALCQSARDEILKLSTKEEEKK
jgi:hypothetical protein